MNYFYDRNLQHVSIAVSSEVTTDEIIEYYPANESADDQAAITVSSSDAPEKYSIAKENRDISLLEPVCAAVPAEDTDLKLPTQQPENSFTYTVTAQSYGLYTLTINCNKDNAYSYSIINNINNQPVNSGSSTGDFALSDDFFAGTYTVTITPVDQENAKSGDYSVILSPEIVEKQVSISIENFGGLNTKLGDSTAKVYIGGYISYYLPYKFSISGLTEQDITSGNYTVSADILLDNEQFKSLNINKGEKNFWETDDYIYEKFNFSQSQRNHSLELCITVKCNDGTMVNESCQCIPELKSTAAVSFNVDNVVDANKYSEAVDGRTKENADHCWIGVAANMLVAQGYYKAGGEKELFDLLSAYYFAKDGKTKGSDTYRIFNEFLGPNSYTIDSDNFDPIKTKKAMESGPVSLDLRDFKFSLWEKAYGEHVLTAYDIKFDTSGNPEGIYFADSDDDYNKGKSNISYHDFERKWGRWYLSGEEWYINDDATISPVCTLLPQSETGLTLDLSGVYEYLDDYNKNKKVYNNSQSLAAGTTVNHAIIKNKGALSVKSKAAANNVTIHAGGSVTALAGSTISNLSIDQSAKAVLNASATLKGDIDVSGQLSANGYVNAGDAVINLDITDLETVNKTPLITNIHYLKDADFSISLSSLQTTGKYTIATAATAPKQSFDLYCADKYGSANAYGTASSSTRAADIIGTISAGQSIKHGNFIYSLNYSNKNLIFSIALRTDIDTTPPTIPLSLSAKVNKLDVSLSWKTSTDNKDNEVFYTLCYGKKSDFSDANYITTDDNSALLNKLAPGTYYYRVAAYDSNKNSSNWSKTAKFTIAPLKKSLKAAELAISQNCYTPQSGVNLSWNLTNNSSATSAESYSKIIISTDKIFDKYDTELATVWTDSLAAGETIFDSQTIFIPKLFQTGKYYIGFAADCGNDPNAEYYYDYNNVSWLSFDYSTPTASSNYGQLLTVPTWNQRGPWNNNCPMSASKPDKRTIAGCGPIAAAQILYALKAPGSLTFDSSDAYSTNGISIDSAYSSLDFPSFEELNKKLSSIKYDNSPEEAAMLTFAVGVKLQASYTASATSSYVGTAFFTEDCGFDSAKYMSISSAKNSDGTFKQEYIDVIADNIKNGSPVLLNIPNHYVFIEDYDRLSNKFYINYGWGGSNDGWYHLHDINGQGTKGVMFDIIPEFGNEPIVVNSTADYGVGTLRRAIELANNVKGENSIVFDRSMAGKTITIDSELQITDKVNITGLDSANVTITRSGSFSVLYQNSNAAGSTYSGITVDGNNYSSDVMRFYGDSQLSNVTIKNAAGNAIYAAYNTITALDNKCNLNSGTSKRLVNVPGKISSAQAVYKDKAIKFSWTNADDKEDGTVNSCRIEYSESADMSDAKSVTATGTSFTLKNVAAARNYFWRICNVDKDGNDGIFSEVRHIYTGSDTTAPSAVSGLTAKLEDIRAFLSWKPADDKNSNVSHYILEYANNKSFSKATRITTEDTSFKLSGLTTDLAYYWRVAAVDHCGNQSSFSPAKTFTANPRTLIVTETLHDPIKTDRNLKIGKSGSCIVTGSQFSENSYAYPVNLTGYTTEVYHYGTLKLSAAKNSAALIKAANITGGVIGGNLYIDGNASNKTLYGISASNLQLNEFSTKLTVKSSGSMNGYGIYISDSLSEINNFSGSITITVPQSAYAIYSYGTMTIKNLSAAAALNISSTESNARGIYLYNYDDIKDFSLTIDNLQCKISVNSANGSSTGILLANSSARTDCNISIGKWSGTTTVSANTYSCMLNHSCYSSEVHNGSTSIKTFSAKAVVSSKSSQAYGISSDYRINIGNLSGSIMVSSENTGAYGIFGDSTVKITGTLATNANSNSSAIYSETQSNITVSGIVAAIKDRYNASTNKSAVANFVSQLRKYRSGSVSSLPQAERGYAFCCYGNENDTITLQNKALVYGNTYFSGGNDKLTIYSGAQLSGSINANGNLNITFKINSFGNKALITTASLYELTDSATSLNISLDSYLPGGKQILIKYDGTRTSFDKEITVSIAGKKYTMSANGTAKTVNGYTLKLSWEKQSQLVLTCSDKRTLSKLSGSSKTLSWKAGSTPTDGFSLDYSSDKFDHTLRINSATSSVDIFSAPKNSYQWKVKYAERDTWFNGADIAVAAVSKTPKTITANANGNMDVMFTTTYAKWSSNYQAKHKGIKNIWSGTAETEELSGKNKIADIFKGSSDANILLLTDDANGDALFLDDIYTDLPKTTLKNQARVIQIKEIRAGNGDDIIDMTSQQFSYTGSGVRIYGGSGNDIIWANKGNHTIFGGSGNDRMIGGNGNDVLAGGAGNDRMHGGGGKDIFTFGSNWGKDFVEQLDGGEVTLWFKSGSIDKWNDKTLTYADGNNFVHVSGVSNDKITLKFGDDKSTKFDTLNDSKAFSDTASEKIFEDKNKGMLA